jgi:hypothetical protein
MDLAINEQGTANMQPVQRVAVPRRFVFVSTGAQSTGSLDAPTRHSAATRYYGAHTIPPAYTSK